MTTQKKRGRPTKPRTERSVKNFTFRLTDEMMEQIRAAAARECRTMSGQILYMLKRGLE
jgi:hypothetical protein